MHLLFAMHEVPIGPVAMRRCRTVELGARSRKFWKLFVVVRAFASVKLHQINPRIEYRHTFYPITPHHPFCAVSTMPTLTFDSGPDGASAETAKVVEDSGQSSNVERDVDATAGRSQITVPPIASFGATTISHVINDVSQKGIRKTDADILLGNRKR